MFSSLHTNLDAVLKRTRFLCELTSRSAEFDQRLPAQINLWMLSRTTSDSIKKSPQKIPRRRQQGPRQRHRNTQAQTCHRPFTKKGREKKGYKEQGGRRTPKQASSTPQEAAQTFRHYLYMRQHIFYVNVRSLHF